MIMKQPLLSLIVLTALPVFAQNREADVLSPLSFLVENAAQPSSANDAVVRTGSSADDDFTALVGVLSSANNSSTLSAIDALTAVTAANASTTVANTGSALDFILSDSRNVADRGIASGLGVLSSITGAYSTNNFYSTGVWLSPTGTMSGSRGYYASPEWGRITSGFGYRSRFKRMHKGIDIAMAVGDTVRVVKDGIIDKVAYEARGYGHYVVVRHDDGMETRYAHLSQSLVVAGQRVMADEPIALSGNSGNSTGPHLHFETRYNGGAVDPTTVFDFGNNGSGSFGSGYDMSVGGSYYDNAYAKTYNTYVQDHSSPMEIATGLNATKRSLTEKRTYIVREGDTLQKIAERAGISLMRLCQLNGIIDNDMPAIGTMLRLR